MKTTPIVAGDIFFIAGRYWKVTGPKRGAFFPVIRCSKNGKEFTDINGFFDRYLETAPAALFIKNVSEQIKVSRDGVNSGRQKRRIAYLKNRIANDQKELAKLENSDNL